MTSFFLLLIRLVALSLSFALSTLIAAGFFTFALFLGGDVSWLENDVEVFAASIAFISFTWIAFLQLTFAPACIAFAVLEAGRMGSMLANLLAGGFCAVVGMLLIPATAEATTPYTDQEVWLAVLASGFVGGFAHWALAGFRAGRWMGPKTETDIQAR